LGLARGDERDPGKDGAELNVALDRDRDGSTFAPEHQDVLVRSDLL
jgi:hypothetical protein